MTKDIFFHGTSSKQAALIQKSGFDASRGKPKWTVSDAKNYFLSFRKIRKCYCDKETAIREALQGAAFHAALAAAIDGSPAAVIFAVSLKGIEYEDDSSCFYPEAVQVNRPVPRTRIVSKWVSFDRAQAFAPFVVGQVIRNRFADKSIFPSFILDLAKSMNMDDGFSYFPDLFESLFE